MAFQDGFAEDDFAMPVRERGIKRRRREIAGVDILVKAAEAALEGVGKTFVVAAREGREMASGLGQ